MLVPIEKSSDISTVFGADLQPMESLGVIAQTSIDCGNIRGITGSWLQTLQFLNHAKSCGTVSSSGVGITQRAKTVGREAAQIERSLIFHNCAIKLLLLFIEIA